jgi:hypothetical protein
MRAERVQTNLQGLAAGFIGYVAVALFFAIFNLIGGRSPFFTAAFLGDALFYGVRDPAAVVVWPGPVFAYNGVHLLMFLALGLVASWLAFLSERGPQFWYIGAILFLFVVFHLYGFVLLVTGGIQAVLPTWTVFASTVLAGTAMFAYLLWVHPRFRSELHDFREE